MPKQSKKKPAVKKTTVKKTIKLGGMEVDVSIPRRRRSAVDAVDAKLAKLAKNIDVQIYAPMPKLSIQEACAALDCTEPPLDGTSYCGTHTVAAMKEIIDGRSAKPNKSLKEEAQTVCVEPGCREIIRASASMRRCDKHREARLKNMNAAVAKVQKEVNQALARPATKKLLAELSTPAPVAPLAPETMAAFYADVPKQSQRSHAKTLTRKLVKMGWSIQRQAEATGVTDGSVYRWYRASSAPTPAQFEALQQMLQNPPDTAVAAATGSIKAPGKRAASAKSAALKPAKDPRQLMLALRDALNEALSAGN